MKKQREIVIGWKEPATIETIWLPRRAQIINNTSSAIYLPSSSDILIWGGITKAPLDIFFVRGDIDITNAFVR